MAEDLIKNYEEKCKDKKLDIDVAEIEYNETTFWNNVKAKKIPNFDAKSLLPWIREMIASFYLGPSEQVYPYNCCLIVGSQLKNPENLGELLLSNDENTEDAINPINKGNWTKATTQFAGIQTQTELKHRKDQLDSFSTVTETEVFVWGPFVAFILARFERRQTQSAIAALSRANSVYEQFYPNGVKLNFTFGDIETITRATPNFTTGQFDVEIKKCVFKSMIVTREKAEGHQQTQGLLDFYMLQSLRYTGMTLVTLMAQATALYGCSDAQLTNCIYEPKDKPY
ncbi:hypothetical protein PGB90_002971 [Kerria lacca]